MDKLKVTFIIGLILIVYYYVFNYYYIFRLLSYSIKALTPIFIGFLIAFIFEPIIVSLTRSRIDRKVACIYVFFMSFVVSFILLRYLIPPIFKQIGDFITQIPILKDKIYKMLSPQIIELLEMIDIEALSTTFFSNISRVGMNFIENILNKFMVFSLGLGASMYISLEFNQVKRHISKYVPRKHFKDYWYLSKKMTTVTFGYFRGLLWDSLILFVMSLIALYLIGFEYPYVFALLITITNLIPYIGPYIGGIPVILIGFSQSATLGIQCTIIIFVTQYIESTFIQPIIMKNVIDLHPVINILGVSFFGSLFGVIGMILSRLILAYIKIFYEDFLKIRLNKEKNDSVIDSRDC